MSAGLWGQTRVDLGRQGRNVDFRSETATLPAQSGGTLPALCEPAEVFIKISAPEGANVYLCVEQNRWAPQIAHIVGTGGIHSICGSGTCTLQADTGYLQWRKNGQDGVDLLVAANSGSASAYRGCPTTNTPPGKVVEAYTAGMRVYLLPDVSSAGGATTLDVCNLRPKALKRSDGSSDPGANDLAAGHLYRIWFDGAVFRLPDVSWGAISGSLADQGDLQTVLNGKQSLSARGQANGYASLGADGKVPVSQLPEGQGSGATVSTLQSGLPWIVTTVGGPSAYTGTMDPALTADRLRPGTRLVWVVNADCAAGPVSLAIDGAGVKPVKKATQAGLSDPPPPTAPRALPWACFMTGRYSAWRELRNCRPRAASFLRRITGPSRLGRR